MMYFEPSLLRPGERILQRIENFCPFHAGFAALCEGEKLRGTVSRLFGEPAVLFKDKINFKLPGGDGFKPHQDQQAGWSAYADLFITAMVTIDPTTAENGCLSSAPDSTGRLRGGVDALTDGDAPSDARPVPTRAGTLFFDSYTPHASGPNLTAERRRVLYITYNAGRPGITAALLCRQAEELPPDIERDPTRTYTFRV
jgi:ectoine hydroxylase-related dioxygenase (phytanoyl-CoA dioxygenase family)